jgi:PIN domain nuclease of toxin-antitoxin system
VTISELTASDRVVMDTHVWVWASGEAGGTERLGEDCLRSVERAARDRRLYVCAASVWEIALKARRGRAIVRGNLGSWVREQRLYPGVRLLPIDARLAIESMRLPEWLRSDGREHRDPCDRFLVATARRLNAVLLTCDGEILEYGERGHVRAKDGSAWPRAGAARST